MVLLKQTSRSTERGPRSGWADGKPTPMHRLGTELSLRTYPACSEPPPDEYWPGLLNWANTHVQRCERKTLELTWWDFLLYTATNSKSEMLIDVILFHHFLSSKSSERIVICVSVFLAHLCIIKNDTFLCVVCMIFDLFMQTLVSCKASADWSVSRLTLNLHLLRSCCNHSFYAKAHCCPANLIIPRTRYRNGPI